MQVHANISIDYQQQIILKIILPQFHYDAVESSRILKNVNTHSYCLVQYIDFICYNAWTPNMQLNKLNAI